MCAIRRICNDEIEPLSDEQATKVKWDRGREVEEK